MARGYSKLIGKPAKTMAYKLANWCLENNPHDLNVLKLIQESRKGMEEDPVDDIFFTFPANRNLKDRDQPGVSENPQFFEEICGLHFLEVKHTTKSTINFSFLFLRQEMFLVQAEEFSPEGISKRAK